MSKKMELVAPGGSLEKMEYAYHYGADAVYVGLPDFSLRARTNEFDEKKLEEAVKIARGLGRKIYFTLNVYPHEEHLAKLKEHLKFVSRLRPDALIISDPGTLRLARKFAPKIKIHLSTQANATNSEAMKFWASQGVSRIVLAREVTLQEIKEIKKQCPQVEIECFVHGAMCMSLSGRCFLSSWFRGRSANLGDCVQPCRWPYRARHNTKNTGQEKMSLEIWEDEHGSYLLNSRDLCLIEHLDKLGKAGVSAAKIEGRTKSVYYVAVAVKAYRNVIDAINSPKRKGALEKISKKSKAELNKLSNRGYSTGFLFGKDKWKNNLASSHQRMNQRFVGQVLLANSSATRIAKSSSWSGFSKIKIHNLLKIGDRVEVLTPEKVFSDQVKEIVKSNGEKAKSAHGGANNVFRIKMKKKYPPYSILRKDQGNT